MKRSYTLTGIMFGILLAIQTPLSAQNIQQSTSTGHEAKVMAIDSQDSVFFDLTQATINGTTIEFPVYIKSDDPINALDFSFRYDHMSCDYDTIINLTTYVEMLSNYNTNDSTVYFTSYSFTQTYPNNVSIVNIRFNIPSGQFSAANIYGISAFLNGDACSYAVLDASTGLNEGIFASGITVYPNPSAGMVNVDAMEKIKVDLLAMDGSVVYMSTNELKSNHQINTETIPAGTYLIRMYTNDKAITKKLIINR